MVCIVLTPCLCFVSLVCFGSFRNLILSGFAKGWCHFPSRTLPYTSILQSVLFLEIDVCVYPYLYLTFWQHDSNTDSILTRKSVDYFAYICVVYATMV